MEYNTLQCLPTHVFLSEVPNLFLAHLRCLISLCNSKWIAISTHEAPWSVIITCRLYCNLCWSESLLCFHVTKSSPSVSFVFYPTLLERREFSECWNMRPYKFVYMFLETLTVISSEVHKEKNIILDFAFIRWYLKRRNEKPGRICTHSKDSRRHFL